MASYFKPRGIPLSELEEAVVGLDELEALRLADVEGLSQEDAGKRMGVSRGTIGRLLERAHRTVADALLQGKALRLEGGPITTPPRGPGRTGGSCPKVAGACERTSKPPVFPSGSPQGDARLVASRRERKKRDKLR